ncbi:MAG: protein-export chaperone SecB [Gammaproteobacteria bacterium]|nr:MAG: protein-export chaperone SecB [Gammaproteobacteria bacterium]
MSDQKANKPAATNADQKGQFSLQRIYIKDLSFESPGSPDTFRKEWKPEINLDLNSQNVKVQDDIYEVVLSVTVTAKNDNDVAFLVEVQQAGLFQITGMPEAQMKQLLGAYCPNILFPYARETVSDVITRGSFPQLLLAPVNFDALYADALQRQAGGSAAS